MVLKSSLNISSLLFLAIVACIMASKRVMRIYENKDSFGLPGGYRIVIYKKEIDDDIKAGRREAKNIETIRYRRENYKHIYDLPEGEERFVLTLDSGSCPTFLVDYGTIVLSNPQDEEPGDEENQKVNDKLTIRPKYILADPMVF